MKFTKVTQALYETYSDEQLAMMRRAFERDKQREADDSQSVAFCDQRIAIIDAVLSERRT